MMTLSAVGAAHFASACAALLFGSIVLLELFAIAGMILVPRLQARALAHQRVD